MTHRCAFAVIPLLIAIGCTGGPTFAPVSGKVIKDGKPMAGASLTFQPNSSNNPGPGSYGRTDASGVFELKVVTTDAPGAVVGPHKVYITPAGKPPDPEGRHRQGEVQAVSVRVRRAARRDEVGRLRRSEEAVSLFRWTGSVPTSRMQKVATHLPGAPHEEQQTRFSLKASGRGGPPSPSARSPTSMPAAAI